MRHDEMCAKYGLDDDPGQGVWGYEPPVRPCDCARFAKVRADERARIRAGVDALSPVDHSEQYGDEVILREVLAVIDPPE